MDLVNLDKLGFIVFKPQTSSSKTVVFKHDA